jgi:signal transduction histidine kinase
LSVDRKLPAFARFSIGSALVLGLVLGLVWAMTLRERSVQRLYLEYETYRASAALFEAIRLDPALLPNDERVLGFGIYRGDGTAIQRIGTAPEALDPLKIGDSPAPRRLGSSSIVLQRPIGPGQAGMPGMMSGMRGQGRRSAGPMGGFGGNEPRGRPGGAYGQGLGSTGAAGPGPYGLPGEPALNQPRAVWIDYGLGSFARNAVFLYGAAVIVTVALLSLYVILLGLYRRNADLRERDMRNRELVQLGEAAGTLVHEIKNPLGIIRVQAASLRRLEPATAVEKAAVKADMIEDEVMRLAGLADRIRDFLKGGEGSPKEIDLGAWLETWAKRYATAPGQGPMIGQVDAEVRVRIDPDRLAQALDNLVRNAQEAAPEGPPPEVSVVFHRYGAGFRSPVWELAIADRGDGVQSELEERIFEPFFTTKEKGMGIGLALARRIARSSGGELEYRPRQGGGAVFSLILPAV